MKYLTDNFKFVAKDWKPEPIDQVEALQELRNHGSPCFIPVIKKQAIATTISKLLGYHDNSSSYEPEILLARNAYPTPSKVDTIIVAIEAEAGEPCSDGLLWYKVAL